MLFLNLIYIKFQIVPVQINYGQNSTSAVIAAPPGGNDSILPRGSRTEQWPNRFNLPDFLDFKVQGDLKTAEAYYKELGTALPLDHGQISK